MIRGRRLHRTESTGTGPNARHATRFVSAGPLALEWRISLADRWFAGAASEPRHEAARAAQPERPPKETRTAA